LSSELKARLLKVAEEDRKQEEKQLAVELPRMKDLLFEISRVKQFDVLIWMEGTMQGELSKDEQDLGLLERANLVKSQTRYTHRNVYRRYELTAKGIELAEKIHMEK
jgi:hypothetical protein